MAVVDAEAPTEAGRCDEPVSSPVRNVVCLAEPPVLPKSEPFPFPACAFAVEGFSRQNASDGDADPDLSVTSSVAAAKDDGEDYGNGGRVLSHFAPEPAGAC